MLVLVLDYPVRLLELIPQLVLYYGTGSVEMYWGLTVERTNMTTDGMKGYSSRVVP
jgi:hypothetical protein